MAGKLISEETLGSQKESWRFHRLDPNNFLVGVEYCAVLDVLSLLLCRPAVQASCEVTSQ